MDILLYTVCILEPTLNKCYYTILYGICHVETNARIWLKKFLPGPIVKLNTAGSRI